MNANTCLLIVVVASRSIGLWEAARPKARSVPRADHPSHWQGAYQRRSVARRSQKVATSTTRAAIIGGPDRGAPKQPPMAPPPATCSRGSVQQGLSATGGAFGFYPLGLAADKRYSLGGQNHCNVIRIGTGAQRTGMNLARTLGQYCLAALVAGSASSCGIGTPTLSTICLTNSVYLPRGQAGRNQEHLLRQINLVGLNHASKWPVVMP